MIGCVLIANIVYTNYRHNDNYPNQNLISYNNLIYTSNYEQIYTKIKKTG